MLIATTSFGLNRTARFALYYLEIFLVNKVGKIAYEVSMSTKNIKFRDVGKIDKTLEEVNEDKDLEGRVGKIINYAILSAADWDEDKATKLTQTLNQHAWRSFVHNRAKFRSLWSSRLAKQRSGKNRHGE